MAISAYPPGLKGGVAAEGNTYEQALAEVITAIQFNLDTFGQDALSDYESPVIFRPVGGRASQPPQFLISRWLQGGSRVLA